MFRETVGAVVTFALVLAVSVTPRYGKGTSESEGKPGGGSASDGSDGIAHVPAPRDGKQGGRVLTEPMIVVEFENVEASAEEG